MNNNNQNEYGKFVFKAFCLSVAYVMLTAAAVRLALVLNF